MASTNEKDLVKNISFLYQKSLLVADDFEGPSIYFHVQAIKEQKRAFLSDRHIEMIYATLASWGLHRMGDPKQTKTKMVKFEVFKNSLIAHYELLASLRGAAMAGTSETEYKKLLDILHPVYNSLMVSLSSSTLVANSKVLAHVLPDLIPPIDRQYTVRFFTQEPDRFFNMKGKFTNINLPTGKQEQFSLFIDYCIRIKRMLDLCNLQQFILAPETFNTSYPKIMDNIIMSYIKHVAQNKLV